MSLLQIADVRKSFGTFQALKGVSFDVKEGAIYGLLGPNGAGKTTLIRCINQITHPDSGQILLSGAPLKREDVRRIGYLPEERGLYKKMKVGDQALYLAQLKGMSKRDAMRALKYWFDKFGIADWWSKKVEELSKGMAQKVQFIVTVLHEPRLLIFDEMGLKVYENNRYGENADWFRGKANVQGVIGNKSLYGTYYYIVRYFKNKKEEVQKSRDTIKNTLRFDPQVLKRFVNFVNNPDEETAVAQFGKGDKYFGVCTLMVTMPGLPMFGHGQIEGFEEKYGMEYTRAYRNESPDEGFIARHRRDIFPLMKKRRIFADVENFLFYDLWNEGGVDENVFAYSNSADGEYSIVIYNNAYERTAGRIKESVPYALKTGNGENDKMLVTRTIAEGLQLGDGGDTYCIFREQRSGLYYIRKNDDIRENGLFASLNGFESQVYTDIRQVADTDTHKYSILCETLAGRGAEDFDTFWEEIEYRELYKALESFAALLIPKVKMLLCPDDKASYEARTLTEKARQITEEVKESALAFYTVAKRFAENDGITLSSPETQFKQFNKIFLASVSSYGKLLNGKSPLEDNKKLLKTKNTDDILACFMLSEKNLPILLICLATIAELAARGCAKKFNFARKLAEYIKRTGCPNCPDRNELMRVIALAPLAEKTVLLKRLKTAAYDAALYLMQSENAPMLSGSNLFDGIRWFNKELSDSSLTYYIAAATLYAPDEKKDFVRALYFLLNDAKIKASFKCELFINQFAPNKGSKALPPVGKREAAKITTAGLSGKKHKELTMAMTTVKKPAVKKPAAKKTTAKKTVAKKTTAKKPAAAKKTAAKKPAAKKTAAKKTTAKKTVAKKTTAKKTVAKKTTAKKPVAKK